jgi:hypothetical protein
VQDVIGEWHDWDMLAKIAEKQFRDRLNCPLLVEVRTLFSAKHSVATTAAERFIAAHTSAAAKKQPRAVNSSRALSRRA